MENIKFTGYEKGFQSFFVDTEYGREIFRGVSICVTGRDLDCRTWVSYIITELGLIYPSQNNYSILYKGGVSISAFLKLLENESDLIAADAKEATTEAIKVLGFEL